MAGTGKGQFLWGNEKNINMSDKTVKIININFCQFKQAFKRSWFQFIMIGNNCAYLSFACHFRKTYMASRLPGYRKPELFA